MGSSVMIPFSNFLFIFFLGFVLDDNQFILLSMFYAYLQIFSNVIGGGVVQTYTAKFSSGAISQEDKVYFLKGPALLFVFSLFAVFIIDANYAFIFCFACLYALMLSYLNFIYCHLRLNLSFRLLYLSNAAFLASKVMILLFVAKETTSIYMILFIDSVFLFLNLLLLTYLNFKLFECLTESKVKMSIRELVMYFLKVAAPILAASSILSFLINTMRTFGPVDAEYHKALILFSGGLFLVNAFAMVVGNYMARNQSSIFHNQMPLLTILIVNLLVYFVSLFGSNILLSKIDYFEYRQATTLAGFFGLILLLFISKLAIGSLMVKGRNITIFSSSLVSLGFFLLLDSIYMELYIALGAAFVIYNIFLFFFAYKYSKDWIT